MSEPRRIWISRDFDIIQTPDFTVVPRGHNLLETYAAGWISVTMYDSGPVVEGQDKYIKAASPIIANAIGEYYGQEMVGGDWNRLIDPEYREFFYVTVVSYDQRGRPLRTSRVPLRSFLVADIPAVPVMGQRVRAYRRGW